MLLTVIILFCLIPFLFTTVFACSNYNGSTDSEAADLHRRGTGFSNLEHEICGDDADEGTLQITTGTEEQPTEPAPLANGASNDEKKNHTVLKDAYEKEVADIKEKRNNVWCHLALTLDATTLMLMRLDCVGDDGIGDRAKAWKLLQERFQRVEMPTVVTLVAQLARLQLEDSEDLDKFFIRGQELLTRLQEAGEAVSEHLFNALVLNGLPMRY